MNYLLNLLKKGKIICMTEVKKLKKKMSCDFFLQQPGKVRLSIYWMLTILSTYDDT